MSNEIQDPQDWEKGTSALIDPEREAMSKTLINLAIDEAIVYRPSEFFPPDSDKRIYKVAARVDGNYRRALKIISRKHKRTIKGNNQFIAVVLGMMKIPEKYSSEIGEICRLFEAIESGTDDYLYHRAEKRVSISQTGPLTQIQIGLTMAGENHFDDLAEALGLTVSALVVVCFWESVTTSRHLPDHLLHYGQNIQEQFAKHLKSRLHELNFSN